MIPSVVCITGPMRSGTSLAAEVVHRLGWQVSGLIPAPAPPSWRSDWEDADLTLHMIQRKKINWERYLYSRVELSHLTGFGGRIALKSPYLALHYGALRRHAPDAFWIRCERDGDAIERSMDANPALSWSDQYRISNALDTFAPSFLFEYEDAVEAPWSSVSVLAAALGVTDQKTIEAAAALIGSPTEYELCLPSSL